MAYGNQQLGALSQMMHLYGDNFGPRQLMSGTNTIFQGLMQSPIAHAQMANIGAASGGVYARTARAAGRRGLTTSGVSTLATPAARASGTSMMSDFLAQLYGQSLQASLTNLGQQAQGVSYSSQQIRYPDPHFRQRQIGSLVSGLGGAIALL